MELDEKPMASNNPIPLSVPHMSGREREYVAEAFASNWLSTLGPNVDAFEREFEERFGLPAVAVSSGTAAIHLGLRALGVGPGDTVLCSDLTFVASVNPVRYLGAEPVLIDSERESWNMDPGLLRAALAEHAASGTLPKAVIVVHLFGQCANLDAILEICRPYGVPVLEDAAEALGAQYRGRPAGTMGDVGVFSFNGNKIITTTGGGMLVARRPELAERARFWATQARDPGLSYEHSEIGYNYRLSNVLAGIGRAQLQALDDRVLQRRGVALRYREAFADLPGISMMPQAVWGFSTNWLSCFLVDAPEFGCSRDGLVQSLTEFGIESRPVWKPMHLQPLYGSACRYGGSVAEDLYRRGICLPSSSSLAWVDQSRVIRQVRLAAAASIRRSA
jgi:pyridoxal phosphate-dependent aminotransferase EpsN